MTAQKSKSAVRTRQGIKKCKKKVRIIRVLGSPENALRKNLRHPAKSCDDGAQAGVRQRQNPLLDKK